MRSLILMVTILSLFIVSCRDDDDDSNTNNVNNVNNTMDDTVYDVQNPNDPDFIGEGDPVNLENVIVTAIDKYGDRSGSLWVAEPDGGAWSGVQVFNYDTTAEWFTSLQVGDMVDIQGDKDEYSYEDPETGDPLFEDPITEIVNPIVSYVGTGTPVAPVDIQVSDFNTVANGEQWEGVLVRLTNVRVLTAGTYDGRYEVELYQGTKAQDDLVDLSGITDGVCLSHMTGVVTYFFGYYILPRSASDFEIAANDSDCPMVASEICDDDIDNDGNGFVDCDDFACIGNIACPAKIENNDTLCADGIDNDDDGLTDCADPSCNGHPDVTVCTETNCTDGIDNDGDGYGDCDDFDCKDEATCAGEYETNCTDGVDDDGDGYIDCADFDCDDDPACIENCTDGVDNNGDGFIDCADFYCQYNEPTCQAGKELTDATCSDGIDNDENGHADCDDFSCQRNPNVTVCEGNVFTCSDGIDNDGNGFVDCADFACRYCPTGTGTPRVVATCPPCD
ncbi:hypothetical protein KKF84_12240 [Myxococcota bacterium]|nr:hypothetical protein [Myxococcota bacterium]MBU1536084.1 hypothetical protein [Myxococcota bacterium]